MDAEPKAINPSEWQACGGQVDITALAGRPCYGGLDLSSTRDLSALVLFFPEDGGAILPYIWCPKATLGEKEEIDRVPYRTWAQQEQIIATPGAAIDKRFIAATLVHVCEVFDVRGIAFDRWGMPELQKILNEEGATVPLIPWGQGFKDMAPAVNAFETALIEGKLCHGMHPVLRWAAGNLILETDPAGGRKPSKNRSIDKIDPMVSLIMACGLAARDEGPARYKGGGVRWL